MIKWQNMKIQQQTLYATQVKTYKS